MAPEETFWIKNFGRIGMAPEETFWIKNFGRPGIALEEEMSRIVDITVPVQR